LVVGEVRGLSRALPSFPSNIANRMPAADGLATPKPYSAVGRGWLGDRADKVVHRIGVCVRGCQVRIAMLSEWRVSGA
jgi:hypothetical protein